MDEVGRNIHTGEAIVSVDPSYFRPTEVDILVGDASKANKKLGWKPKYELEDLIKEMMFSDLNLIENEKLLKNRS